MITFWLPMRAATASVGEWLGRRLQSGDVIALTGDLGAGKTTLTQAIARGMGITADVSSPTFALIHEYPAPTPLFHIDPYRLDRPEDFADLGFEEYFQRGGVVIIEWADKVAGLLPPERLTLTLEIPSNIEISESSEDLPRLLQASGTGKRYEALLLELEGLKMDVPEGTPMSAVPINDPSEGPDGQPSCGREMQAPLCESESQ